MENDNIFTNTLSKEIYETTYKYENEKNYSDTIERIAKAASSVEVKEKQKEFYEKFKFLLEDFKFTPGGRTIANLGVPDREGTTLYNCFINVTTDVGIEDPDSIPGIYDMLVRQALTLKSEGGYGTNFSWIRPRGNFIYGIGVRTPGTLKFMELWDKSSEIITSGSETKNDSNKKGEKIKIRKGAQMAVLDIWHPEIEDYITAKQTPGRLTKFNMSVGITEGFIKAVQNDKDWNLIFPDTKHPKYKKEWKGDIEDWKERGYEVIIHKTVKAKDLWNKILKSTYNRAEPGVLYLDLANKLNPIGYCEKIRSSNPCLTGETLVYVADGRGHISIKQLAEENKDVPVFCYDDKLNVQIRWMRNPRITGEKEPIYKVTLEDGYQVRVTENHKFLLTNGEYKQAKDLEYGDSIKTLTKYEANFDDIFQHKRRGNKQDYYWLSCGKSSSKAEHTIVAEFFNNTKIGKGYIVHHKDHNARNNNPKNLEIMHKEDHYHLHSFDKIGDKNPMRRAQTEWSDEKWDKYNKNMSKAISGEKNGRYSGFTNEELKEHALILSKKIGRRFSTEEWNNYAKENGLPIKFSKWRNDHLNGILGLAKWAANELEFEYIDCDPRTVRLYKRLLEQQYNTEIIDGKCFVRKRCEICNKEFLVDGKRPEVGICNPKCVNIYLGLNYKTRALENQKKYYQFKKEELRKKQAEIYTQLKFELKREPEKKEWIKKCKQNNISFEISRKSSPFRNYNKLKEYANDYNHRVFSVEFDGHEMVYNGTVDEFHNFFVGGWESKTKNNKRKWLYVNNLNCGEIPNSTGVCNLGSLNLAKCIKFNNGLPEFNFELFIELVKLGIRFLDNVNDISTAPLPEYTKAAKEKRRIGLGTFGLGSLHYILGIKFGGEESLSLIKKIYKLKAETEILYDAQLGKEKGNFPLFDRNKYFNSYWWKNLKISQEIKDQVEKIGHMRNSHRSMNAPTGNTSVLCDNVSSGIEPVFMKYYVRWVIVPESERHDLRKQGFKFCDFVNGEWKESEHMKFAMRGDEQILRGSFNGENYEIDKNRGLVRANNIEDYGWKLAKEIYKDNLLKLEKLGVFCTTNDLSVDDHLNTLSIISNYTDQACSKTVNVPNNFSFDNFGQVYLQAWEKGIKGITTYRDGTMTAVLEGKSKDETIKESHAPKRPKSLKCDIHFSVSDKEQYYVIVGKLDNLPFEIFTGLNHYRNNTVVPTHLKEGDLIKESKGKYVLYSGMHKIELSNGHSNYNCDALARLTSCGLRHGVPLAFISDQLLKNEGDMFIFSKVIARVLKKYIKDNTKSSESCPECGNKLIFIEGCKKCQHCSFAKC